MNLPPEHLICFYTAFQHRGDAMADSIVELFTGGCNKEYLPDLADSLDVGGLLYEFISGADIGAPSLRARLRKSYAADFALTASMVARAFSP
mgnify:CR=1 FL=1